MPGEFFDGNVLVYLASADAGKANRAEEIVFKGGTVSVQVLNEVANVARKKMMMDWSELRVFLGSLRSLLRVTPLNAETHERGLELAERYGLSIYDAMIAAAALDADCQTLWSEDMHHGLKIAERLTIMNPFRG